MAGEKQWSFLKKSVFLGKTSHAYLFSGLGLGKEQTAKDLARLFNCQNASWETGACGLCLSCREFAKNCHPDLFLLEALPASENEESEINLVRKLTDWLSLKPILGRGRVAIVEAGETLSQPAQSALLKILEEPPGQNLLIILAAFPDLLLPTIVSRTQEIRFQPQVRAGNDDFARTSNSSLVGWFQKIKVISQDRQTAIKTIEGWMASARLIFLERLGSKGETEKLKKFLKKAGTIDYLLARTNVNAQLALENLALELF